MKNKIAIFTILAALSINTSQQSYSQNRDAKIKNKDGSKKISGEPGFPSLQPDQLTKARITKTASGASKTNEDVSEERIKWAESLAKKLNISPSMKLHRENGSLMIVFSKEPSKVIADDAFTSLPGVGEYLGTATDEGIPDGLGILVYDDNSIYEGPFVSGKKSGWGKLTYPDGTVQYGDWVNDKFVIK